MFLRKNAMIKASAVRCRIIWTVIVLYTGVIYATLPFVSFWRTYLVETFGYSIFNTALWLFAALGTGVVLHTAVRRRGADRLRALIGVFAAGAVYAYYLTDMKYPVERLHFLEYGILGALLLTALRHRTGNRLSLFSALCIGYWIGLGDEAIQGLLASRVGEIRDSLINAVSVALGICLAHSLLFFHRTSRPPVSRHFREAVVFAAISTCATALFTGTVHGFGYRHETCGAGRIYSSLPAAVLAKINRTGRASEREMRLYDNEALRHVFQREFYRTNDFLAHDGTFYRQYWKSWYENRILHTYYPLYVQKHRNRDAGNLVLSMDRDVGIAARGTPVLWPDSLLTRIEAQTGNRTHLYKSRVKETLITSFGMRELLFYTTLTLAMLAWVWIYIPSLCTSSLNNRSEEASHDGRAEEKQ